MDQILKKIGLAGLIPVVVIEKEENAVPLAEALMKGGLSTIEITFRTAAAAAAIKLISQAHPDMLLGAGTVLTVEQVKAAVNAGAKYIVSPGLNPKVVEYCLSQSIPVTPGIATPSEVEQALELGLKVVKFFPAEANGGIEYLKAISAPYKELMYIPTGGIDEKNLLQYLRFPKTLACGGSWMVKADLIAQNNYDEIRAITKRAVHLMLGLHLAHIGIHSQNETEASMNAGFFSELLGIPIKEGTTSFLAGTQFELLKAPFLGEHGHIAIGTNFIERAEAYFVSNGLKPKEETRKEKNGKTIAVYFDPPVAGFAIHLVQADK